MPPPSFPRCRRWFVAAACRVVTAISLVCAADSPRTQAASPLPNAQEGVASWHGGGRTACGITWRGSELVAAHRSLPLGSHVQVENLRNGRRVTVRVIDRGPYRRGRVIDLSQAAARELDMLGRGTARVRLVAVVSRLP